MNPHHPDEMLEYFLSDSETSVLITTAEYAERCEKICKKTAVRMVIFDDSIRNDAVIPPEEVLVLLLLLDDYKLTNCTC